jgi:hypothetical protein
MRRAISPTADEQFQQAMRRAISPMLDEQYRQAMRRAISPMADEQFQQAMRRAISPMLDEQFRERIYVGGLGASEWRKAIDASIRMRPTDLADLLDSVVADQAEDVPDSLRGEQRRDGGVSALLAVARFETAGQRRVALAVMAALNEIAKTSAEMTNDEIPDALLLSTVLIAFLWVLSEWWEYRDSQSS